MQTLKNANGLAAVIWVLTDDRIAHWAALSWVFWSKPTLSKLVKLPVHLLNDLASVPYADRQNILLTLFSFAEFRNPPSTSNRDEESRMEVELEFRECTGTMCELCGKVRFCSENLRSNSHSVSTSWVVLSRKVSSLTSFQLCNTNTQPAPALRCAFDWWSFILCRILSICRIRCDQ